jgi:hypothetical protein
MTRYQRIAKRALAKDLQGKTEPVLFATVSCWVDDAVKKRGKKRDLYESIFDYEWLLPKDWICRWLRPTSSPEGTGFYMACPRSWVATDDLTSKGAGPGL